MTYTPQYTVSRHYAETPSCMRKMTFGGRSKTLNRQVCKRMSYVMNQPIQTLLSSGGLGDALKRVDSIFVFVEPGSDLSSKDIEAKGNQDHPHANEGKQPGGPLQAKSVVHLGGEEREGSTTSGS